MSTPNVYRWDDANAPVAAGVRTSLCAILYACLVTGYGTKPAAGWTREYVNATFDKAVFRGNPATGTGLYLKIDGATQINPFDNLVHGFEAMTSIDDGLMPFSVTSLYCRTSNAVGTTARPWVLVADDRAFYFFCWNGITTIPGDTSNAVQCLFFGDIVSRFGTDPYACGLYAMTLNNNGSLGYMNQAATSVGMAGRDICLPRAINGVGSPIVAVVVPGGGPGGSIPGQYGVPYAPGDQLLLARPHLADGAAYTFRGFLPGFYYPLHPLPYGQLATVTADGKSFLSLRYTVQSPVGNILISTNDWRA